MKQYGVFDKKLNLWVKSIFSYGGGATINHAKSFTEWRKDRAEFAIAGLDPNRFVVRTEKNHIFSHDEKVKISENMIIYGGSFVKKLGEALRCADDDNARKIYIAFPNYCETYLNFKK